jgi:MoaA/NifB/PqqE/SkfB family radical SAM enzyme
MNILVLKKLINVFICNASRLLGMRHIFGYPYCIFIDPCNFCNLRCPLCVSVLDKDNFKTGTLPLSLYKKVLNHFGPYLTHLYLYNWGEPFLNKNIYEMIEIAKGFDVEVTISSNLNVGDPERIVESGLDVLVCSLDGATQETYQKYRVKGNLEDALNRAKEIVKLKREKNYDRPFLIWQYLLFEHTKEEVNLAKAIAEEIGFDSFYSGPGQVWTEHPVIKPLGGSLNKNVKQFVETATLPEEQQISKRRFPFLMRRDEGCVWLYSSVALDPVGNVFPCCILWKDVQSFATLDQDSIKGIFNSKRFKSARNYFASIKKGKKTDCSFCNSDIHNEEICHCEICQVYPQTYPKGLTFPGLRDYFARRLPFPKILENLLEKLMK